MKNKLRLLPIIVLMFTSCANPDKNDQAAAKENKPAVQLLAEKKLRYLELDGSAYERGFMHGSLLKEEIHQVIALLKENIKEKTAMEADQFIAVFLDQTDYLSAIDQWTPDLLEELKGISEGSGIDFNTILMHQLGDEFIFNTHDILAHHCSSLGVNRSDSQPALAAQNMDIPTFYHGFQTVIKIREAGGKEMLFLTVPGHLGITGLNNRAISVNCNTLSQLNYGKTGLPVTFIVRAVVEKNTQQEALSFLSEITHASGQNYLVGGPDKVYSLECSANKIAEYRPFENASFTYHTNHPMRNDDYSEYFLSALKNYNLTLGQIEEEEFRCQRIRSFQNRFTENTRQVGIAEIKEVLQSRDNDTHDVVSNENTYASVIYELSNTPRFLIAPGKPHEVPYIELNFSKSM